jgi:hypothetical protein
MSESLIMSANNLIGALVRDQVLGLAEQVSKHTDYLN